ncbi:MAG: DUF4351 domain-containing protein [Planctomycetes bacterium]|nr:DUF4351 domain-containing protein [Planctomycetota bacterium]
MTEVPAADLSIAVTRCLQTHEDPTMNTAKKLRQEGRQEGQTEGIRQGLSQGLSQGRAALLERMLEARFGPLPAALRQRLSIATTAELDAIGLRLLDATALEQVLAD